MEYQIISKQSVYLLESDVNKYMAKGWQPLGAPFHFFSRSRHGEFHQAMTRVTAKPYLKAKVELND